MSIISRLGNLIKWARNAKEVSGTGYAKQLIEFYSLSKSPNCLGPAEYFDYQLYDRALTTADKQKFVGYRTEQIYSQLNVDSWHGVANDKVLFEQVMIAAGFNIPKTLAVYHPWRVAGPYCEHLRNLDDLENFLKRSSTFPMFVKPIHGLFGRGTKLVTGYLADSRTVLAHANEALSIEDFHQWLESNSRDGMLFQAMLKPSPEVAKICAERISSVRMIVLIDDEGPRLFRANWKLCTGANIMDNTEGWTNGNLVAAVDHTSGMVQRVYRGVGGQQIRVESHPDTLVPLVGIKVPNWDAMKAYVEEVAKAFPRLRFQAWDIAATENGICAIELNLATMHTVHATQLVSGQGFLDTQLATELKPFI